MARRSVTKRRKGPRKTTLPSPMARSELNALNAQIDRSDLPLSLQMQAAESLAAKETAAGRPITLSTAMSRIANAQLIKQNLNAKRKRGGK